MIIGIDARPLVEKKTGFGYFLSNMLKELLKIDSINTYYLFSDRAIHFNENNYTNVHKILYQDSFYCPKTFYFYYKLARTIKEIGIQLDVFWGTEHIMPRGFSKNVKCILTIHDFTHILFPKSTTKYNLLITKLLYKKSIRNADTIICISNNTKAQLKQFYAKEIKDKDVLMIYEGGFPSDQKKTKNDYSNLRREVEELSNDCFLLFIGTIEPRKNISLLIEAATKLKIHNIKIVICGKIGWEKKSIVEKLYSTENLIYLDYVSDSEKDFLMTNAFCQVQPSLYEGFGLPIIESMQRGTVVLVADNSSMKELVEVDYLKFETENSDDFCKKVLLLYNNKNLYSLAKKYCLNRAIQFNWEEAAKQYLDCFNK